MPDEWIEHIHSSGRHLLALINDVLDLSKVEAGRMELRREPLDLRPRVDDAVDRLRPLATTSGASWPSTIAPLPSSADRVRFRQILDNLLSNAIKFTPEGGRITVDGRSARARGRGSRSPTPGVGIAPRTRSGSSRSSSRSATLHARRPAPASASR